MLSPVKYYFLGILSVLILSEIGIEANENSRKKFKWNLKRQITFPNTNGINPSASLPTRNSNPVWQGRTVPYLLDSNFDESEQRIILGAMLDISSRTCLTFKPKWSSEAKYINFTKGQICRANKVLTNNQDQDERQITLGSQCLKHKGVQGLLLGLLGLPPVEIRLFLNLHNENTGAGSQNWVRSGSRTSLRPSLPSLCTLGPGQPMS